MSRSRAHSDERPKVFERSRFEPGLPGRSLSARARFGVRAAKTPVAALWADAWGFLARAAERAREAALGRFPRGASSQEFHGAFDDGFAGGFALFGLFEQAPDVGPEEVEIGRHVLFAAEAADVVGLGA